MSSNTSTNYDGLTRNTWPGTWSPSGNHPIVLDTEIRGSLQSITGYPGDRLTDIYGQRLQEGMMVYVSTTYTNGGYTRLGNSYYTYKLLTGEIRNNSTGLSPNAEGNWSLFSSGGSTGTQGLVGFTGSTGTQGVVGFTGSQGKIGGVELVFQNVGFNYSVDGFSDSTYPDLTLIKGQLYYFNLTNITSSHPLALRLSSGNTSAVPGTTGNNASSGVYGNGTVSTIVTYQVPFDAPSTIVYQCVIHSGMIGTINIVNQTGFTGSTGTQGLVGFTGSTGTQGIIGFTGSTGTQGVVGFTGSTGTQGIIGFTGSTGTQGLVGFTGSTGTQGIIGFTGSTGTQGLVGFTGSTGTQGLVGFTGSTGTQGVVGFTGSTGTQGLVGFTGSTGTQGVVGFTGSTGTQGEVGFTGSTGTQGLVGFTGSTGTQGVVGFTGSTGTQGVVGFTGSTGTQGVVGFTGSTGTQGVVGFTGSTGTQGLVGFTGSTGTQGVVGYVGSKGESSFTYGPTPPMTPVIGDRWFDTIVGAETVWTDDGDSSQWVEVAASGFVGRDGYTGSSGLGTRTTASGVTSSLTSGTTGNINITGFKGYNLYKIQVTTASWVRIYSSTAARSSDSSRSSGTDPASDAGVITEIITTSSKIVTLTPAVLGFNDETTPTTNVPIAVTNNSTVTTTITVILTMVKTEQ